VNERGDKAERYRAFAERCMELIERLPQDTHGPLTEMAAAWLELAQSELKAKSALTVPASTEEARHGAVSRIQGS
jgi:hypothetical protein